MLRTQILYALMLALPVAVCATAGYFYRRPSQRMRRFCTQMLASASARKAWTLGTLLLLLVANLLYLNIFDIDKQIAVATLFCLCLFTHGKMQAAFDFLHNPAAFWCVFGVQLASFIFPEWWPLTLDSLIVMAASMFYPTAEMREKMADGGELERYLEGGNPADARYYDAKN